MAWQNQYWAANSTNVTVQWPAATTAGGAYIPYVPLQPVTDPSSERDFRSLRDLTPVEWLRRQVEDVCLRAEMAS